MKEAQPRRWRAAIGDLLLVAAVVACFFALAVYLELAERVARWATGYEYLQLDELPLTLLLLSAGLCWFGWRRWHELGTEMRARRLVEQANVRALAHNQTLAQQLIRLQEQERRYLARELHDELGQYCVAIKVDAASIVREASGSSPLAQASAHAIMDAADHLHGAVRDMLHRLRPAGLDELGLPACLQVVIDTWSQRHGISCSFSTEGVLNGLDEFTNVAIYRTIQESLNNVAQHSRAARVAVTVRRQATHPLNGERIVVRVEDNGAGTSIDNIGDGLGILGMRERIDALGGEFSLAPAASGGTIVEAIVPVSDGDRTAK